MSLAGQAAMLVSFPVTAAAVGAGIATVKQPGPRLISAIQHFAAGVVIAALAGEVLPGLRHEGDLGWAVAAFTAGVTLVLSLAAYGRRLDNREPTAPTETTAAAVRALTRAVLPIGAHGVTQSRLDVLLGTSSALRGQVHHLRAQEGRHAHTEGMNLKRVTCRLVGHRCECHRLPDRTVKLTCQRCGLIESATARLIGGPSTLSEEAGQPAALVDETNSHRSAAKTSSRAMVVDLYTR